MNSHWIVPCNLFCVDQKSKMASNTGHYLTIGLYWNSKKTKKNFLETVKETTARQKREEKKFGKYVCVRTRQSSN
jgi:hypothetical protein